MRSRLPLFVFDQTLATLRFPRPNIRYAVHIKPNLRGDVIAIHSRWGDNRGQRFRGELFGRIDPKGDLLHGIAAKEWLMMHKQLPVGGSGILSGIPQIAWVKTGVPLGYRTTEKCRIKTRTGEPRGWRRRRWVETDNVVEPDTLVIQQPTNPEDVHQVLPEDEMGLYFSPAEVAALGLTTEMFPAWAVAQAMNQLRELAVTSQWPEEWPH